MSPERRAMNGRASKERSNSELRAEAANSLAIIKLILAYSKHFGPLSEKKIGEILKRPNDHMVELAGKLVKPTMWSRIKRALKVA